MVDDVYSGIAASELVSFIFSVYRASYLAFTKSKALAANQCGLQQSSSMLKVDEEIDLRGKPPPPPTPLPGQTPIQKGRGYSSYLLGVKKEVLVPLRCSASKGPEREL